MQTKYHFRITQILIVITVLLISITIVGCTNDVPQSISTGSSNGENEIDRVGDDASKGGVLKLAAGYIANNIGLSSKLRNMDELFSSVPALETLGRMDAEGEMQPWLAESWEEDPEDMTLTIELRQGVEFHDGSELNAEVVKWNLDHFRSSGRSELNDIAKVEAVDSYTVQITLDEWNASMLDLICSFVPISSQKVYEEHGEEWAAENPVGTGPFQFVSWERGQLIKYEKFDNYWQEGKPYLDAIELYGYAESQTASASLRAGEIDGYHLAPSMVARDFEQLEDFNVIELTSGLGGSGDGLMMDSAKSDSPFADAKVRRAVAYAIDRQAIVDNLLHGYGIVTNQWSTPGTWSYNEQVDIDYNPEKAKQLLEEAGYPNGFKTSILVRNEDYVVDLMTAVQGYLREIGIQAELNVVDQGMFSQYAPSASGKVWDGIIYYSKRIEPDVATYMPRNFSPNSTTYGHGIIHPEDVVELFEKARRAKNSEELKEYAWELQHLVFEEYALGVVFYAQTLPSIMHHSVVDHGINVTIPSTWTPEDTKFTE